MYSPKAIHKELFLQHEGLEQSIRNETEHLGKHVPILFESLSLDLGLQKDEDVICDVLVIPMNSPPILLTYFRVKENIEDYSTMPGKGNKFKYCKLIAQTLKERLVLGGGYNKKILIRRKIISLSPEGKAILLYNSDFEVPYPRSYYSVTTESVTTFLKALFVLWNNEFASQFDYRVHSE